VKARLERVGLVAAMGLTSVNIWTGAPLLGLWVGSRVAPDSGISMLAFLVVAVVIGAACLALLRLLSLLQETYSRVTGQRRQVRQHTPWLRAMSGERPHETGGSAPRLMVTDYILVGTVMLAVIAFEVWFFFFSGSPLGGGDGRD